MQKSRNRLMRIALAIMKVDMFLLSKIMVSYGNKNATLVKFIIAQSARVKI